MAITHQRLRLMVLGWLLALLGAAAFGQAHRIAGPSAGLVEAGAPPFAIFGEETLGLNSPPTDLRQMPDGRILVVAGQQLAIGDGVRWEVFRQAPKDPLVAGGSAMVDRDGHIYVGVAGGFARVDFGENNLWRLVQVASWEEEPRTRPAPRTVLEVGSEWFWHSGSGSLVSWRPGQSVRIAARTEDVEHVFALSGAYYLSDRNDGSLSRLNRGNKEPVLPPHRVSPTLAITSSVLFNDTEILVGTHARGLQLFDGNEMRPFWAGDALTGDGHINDLCATAGDMFAAAVENFGLVFFDRRGRTVQGLNRSLDHRLSRIQRLVPSANGVIWALLDHGILRVEFPCRISFFEPVIGTGINTAHPYRLEGQLWFVADGKIQRGVYERDGRLAGLSSDTPPNLFVFSFSGAVGVPIAGTEHGAYYRSVDGWTAFAPESDNLRVLENKPRSGRWLYAARGEIGWLRPTLSGIEIKRVTMPDLPNPYNAVSDGQGRVWIEMGLAKVGRITIEEGRPLFESFSGIDGIPESWAQLFEIDGVVRLNVAERIFQFDEKLRRFVPDQEFQAQFPDEQIYGRPGVDAKGQLWMTTGSGVQIMERRGAGWQRVSERMSPRFRPYYFTFEDNGVVWLHSEHRLERYDPRMPSLPPSVLRALITHVTVATNNRTFHSVGAELPPLTFGENSLLVYFAALGNPFTSAVTFDVKLDGAGGDWTPSGSGGSAVFNRLKEGQYTLRVRPHSESVVGQEATLRFTIAPPWYRTTAAYIVYSFSAFGLVLLAGWISSFLERRENVRLEQLVAQRTQQVNASNEQLAAQVEEIRMLSQAISQSPVAVFITKPDGTIVFANPRAAELSGYSSSELLGLNASVLRASSHVPANAAAASSSLAARRGESWRGQLLNRQKDGRTLHVQSMVSPIRSPDGQIRHHLILEEDVTEWIADQEKNRRLEEQLFQAQKLESIGTLAGGIAHDFNNILTGILGYCELARLAATENSELQRDLNEVRAAGLRAKDLVAQILTFSRQGHANLQPVDLAEPVAEALKLVRASTPSTIEIVTSIEGGIVKADTTQIQQVVLNLCTNAVHAMQDRPGRLEVSLQQVQVSAAMGAEIPNLSPGRHLRLHVSDNGRGMEQATLSRIFDPFFTTKRQGEGTGLGLAIVQAIVAGHHGALTVRSVPETGTIFEIFLPVTQDPVVPPVPESAVPRGRQQEIIIVDDEPSVAAFASARLQQLGYVPTMFTEPAQVIEAFAGQPERFHAIVSDLTMPGMTGADLIQQLRSRGWLIPAVIITGYGGDSLREKLNSLPRCIVIQKPFSGDDLARALDQVMNDYAVQSSHRD